MQENKNINELTLEEKIALLSGREGFYTNSISRMQIPAISLADGPHGLRKQLSNKELGVSKSQPSTAFPTAACTANGWNEDNLYKMGQAIAKECLNYGVDILLGPGVNIKRTPLCGRNFEYFSEDPLLAGNLASAQINGLQDMGVGACVKHFALNNSENYRYISSSICDKKAMREIYLKPFEIAVKKSQPHAIMCAYNAINGTFASENKHLYDILRKEWGFNGITMTDWGANRNRVKSLLSGCDLEMPGDNPICRKQIYDAVKSGDLQEEQLDISVCRVLDLVEKYKNNKAVDFSFEEHHKLAGEIAQDCAILMKNDGVLPLKTSEKLLIVGELFEKMRYQGAGSSMINSTKITTPKNAFEENDATFEYLKGYKENSFDASEELLLQLEKKLKESKADKVIIFAGLTDFAESEGCDRENMNLPKNQLEVIDRVIQSGKKVVVVLFGGSPVELPFKNEVSAILNMYLPGQNGGSATYNLIFGKACPSGKLAETWPEKYQDLPFYSEYSKGEWEAYKESVFVGYRYYSTANKKPAFPFGFGLSYTAFEYSHLNVEILKDKITVSCNVKNTGEFYGAEIVELFVNAPIGGLFKPEKELKGYKKVYLYPNEEKFVEIEIELCDLAIFDPYSNSFKLFGGEYKLLISSDIDNVRLSTTIVIQGEKMPQMDEKIYNVYQNCDLLGITEEIFERMSGLSLPKEKLPITLESRFTDLKLTFWGKILYKAVTSVANGQLKKAKKLPEGVERDNKIKSATFLKRIFDSNILLSLSMSSSGRFPYGVALGFMHIANGKVFKGIVAILKPIKAPKLPDKKLLKKITK